MEGTVERRRARTGSDDSCLAAKNRSEPHRLTMANEDYLEAIYRVMEEADDFSGARSNEEIGRASCRERV